MPGALTNYQLDPLPGRKPTGIDVSGTWRYLKAAHASVGGVFDALHLVREKTANARGERRGQLTGDQQDLLRSALVFTSSGLDACCRRLLRDALPVLIEAGTAAEGKFVERLRNELSGGRVSKPLVDAICDPRPRERLIDFYVDALVGSSLQRTTELKRVRDALGVAEKRLTNAQVNNLQDFFTARNRIVHELDYQAVDGTGGRRTQVMGDVKSQCDEVMGLLVTLISATAVLTHAARKKLASS
jgi:hypothetical protein